MSSHRVDKVEKLIKEEVSYILLHKMQDEELGFITVTDVKMSADLKIAKIYLSVLQKERRDFVLNKIPVGIPHTHFFYEWNFFFVEGDKLEDAYVLIFLHFNP